MKIFVNFFFFLAALGAALMLSGVADHVPGSETVGWGSVGFSLLLAIVLFGLTDEENPLVREMEPLDDDECKHLAARSPISRLYDAGIGFDGSPLPGRDKERR